MRQASSCNGFDWVVQAQTRSVGVWIVVLVGRKERVVSRLSVLSLHLTSAAQQRLFVHTQMSLCNYTIPPLPSANTLSLILRKRRITSISQHHSHNQRVCCDHQFTDRCTSAYPPAQLTSTAGPTGFAHGAPRRPLHPATSLSTPRS